MENTALTISCQDLIAALNAYQKENGVVIRYVYYISNKTSMYYILRPIGDKYNGSGNIHNLGGMDNNEVIRFTCEFEIENLAVQVDGSSSLRPVDISQLIRSVAEKKTMETVKNVWSTRDSTENAIVLFVCNEYKMDLQIGVVVGFDFPRNVIIISHAGAKREIESRLITSVFTTSLAGVKNLHNFS